MSLTRFEEILQQLSQVFHLELHVDQKSACTIQLHEHLTIQLQLDLSQEKLWLFSKLIEIPPGKFRENVLREALKANALPDPRAGIFGYLAIDNHLALFQKYPLEILTGETLAGLVGAFLELAESWQTAIANGHPAPVTARQPVPPSPFGIK